MSNISWNFSYSEKRQGSGYGGDRLLVSVGKGVLDSAAATVGQDESTVWVLPLWESELELPYFPNGVE